jgi:polysaccharide biosynthesis/export protein
LPRYALRPVLILALLFAAGCSTISDWSDDLVGNSYQRYQAKEAKQAAADNGLSIPPDMNARPNLPQPVVASQQPQYSQVQYAQPQVAQPQVAQSQYAQPPQTVMPPQYAQYAQQPVAAAPQPQYSQVQYAQPQYAQAQQPASSAPQQQFVRQNYASSQMAAAQTQLQTQIPAPQMPMPAQVPMTQVPMPQGPAPLAYGSAMPAQMVTQSAGLPGAASAGLSDPSMENYLIGPGDELDIFVWRNADLTTKVPVRPDGKISIPLVDDVIAVGKTPSMLSREIEERLKAYIKDPIVTVIVSNFVGPFSQQVRVIGEATQPRAIPYRANMTMLDVMIEVGGLTRFAAGDRSVVVRNFNGRKETIKAHLDGLVKDGDVTDNIAMRPGDIVIIPQRYF